MITLMMRAEPFQIEGLRERPTSGNVFSPPGYGLPAASGRDWTKRPAGLPAVLGNEFNRVCTIGEDRPFREIIQGQPLAVGDGNVVSGGQVVVRVWMVRRP